MTRQLHAYPTYIGTTAERTAFDPGSEAITLEFWDTDEGAMYLWDGSVWQNASTVGLPQDLGTGDSPTFAGLTLNGGLSIDGDISLVGAQQISTTTGQLTIGTGGGGGDLYFAADGDIVIDVGTALVSSVPGAGISINEDIDLDGDLDFVGAQEISTTAGNLTLNPAGEVIVSSAATASRLAYLGASKELESVADLTSWIAGTANQITVTDDLDGTVTLATPQDIHNAASPTFAGLTMNGNIVMADGSTIGQAAGPLVAFDDTNNYLEITGCNVGIGTTDPLARLHSGTTISDYAALGFSTTGALISATSGDQDDAESNVLTLMRDGTDGVVYAGAARFDMSQWESSSVSARTQLDIKLSHGATDDLASVLTMQSNGNVGIGTTGPETKLHVVGDTRLVGNLDVGGSAANNYRVGFTGSFAAGTASTYSSSILDVTELTASNGSSYVVGQNWVASLTTQDNSETIGIVAQGRFKEPNITIGTDTITTAATLYIDDAPTEGSVNAALYVNSGISYFGGNVGIGTTGPGSKLDINMVSNSAITNNLRLLNTGSGLGTGSRLGFTTSAGYDRAFIQSQYVDGTNFHNLEFGVGGGGLLDGTVKMVILGNGNVGIGTTGPVGQLHVDQPSATGAIPVLYLDQADVSEEMIQFETTIGTGNAIEAVGAKSLTTTHFIKVTLPGGLTRYIPAGTIA